MLADTHAHLYSCKNVDGVLERAKDIIVVTNGLNPETNRKCLELSKKYKMVYPALGIYPSDAIKMDEREVEKEIRFIRKNKKEIVAIGEAGLDFTYENGALQEKVFEKMINLSKEMEIPLIVHSRKAEERTVNILLDNGAEKVIMHCFNGNFKLVRTIIKQDWMISIPLIIFKSEHFQKLSAEVPIFNLLTETDSPYLGLNGQNEPANVKFIVDKIASIKKIGRKDTEEKIFTNFKKIFGKRFDAFF
jgi:TatD DNase family protein